MKRKKCLKLIAGFFMLASITTLTIGCTKTDTTSTDSQFQNTSSEENTLSNKEKGKRPDFENMTEEEKAEFEAKKGAKPDFENMTDEEKAQFEKNKPIEQNSSSIEE